MKWISPLIALPGLLFGCNEASMRPLEPTTTDIGGSTGAPPAPSNTTGSAETGSSGTVAGESGSEPKYDVHSDDTAVDQPCSPPDILVLLDRSMGMGQTPQGNWPNGAWQDAKFSVAVDVVQALVEAHDHEVNFGLAMFPGDGGAGVCTTIDDPCWQNGAQDTCKTGSQWLCSQPLAQMRIDFALDAAATFAALDALQEPVCYGTPSGAAVELGTGELTALADGSHQQAMILVTDGSSHCQPDFITQVRALADTTDVLLFIIGYTDEFSPGWVALLNDASCAAQTAPNFPAGCTMASGQWEAEDPTGSPTFYSVTEAQAFSEVIESIVTSLDCVEG